MSGQQLLRGVCMPMNRGPLPNLYDVEHPYQSCPYFTIVTVIMFKINQARKPSNWHMGSSIYSRIIKQNCLSRHIFYNLQWCRVAAAVTTTVCLGTVLRLAVSWDKPVLHLRLARSVTSKSFCRLILMNGSKVSLADGKPRR